MEEKLAVSDYTALGTVEHTTHHRNGDEKTESPTPTLTRGQKTDRE
jgi:hypothetical protein